MTTVNLWIKIVMYSYSYVCNSFFWVVRIYQYIHMWALLGEEFLLMSLWTIYCCWSFCPQKSSTGSNPRPLVTPPETYEDETSEPTREVLFFPPLTSVPNSKMEALEEVRSSICEGFSGNDNVGADREKISILCTLVHIGLLIIDSVYVFLLVLYF